MQFPGKLNQTWENDNKSTFEPDFYKFSSNNPLQKKYFEGFTSTGS